MPFSLEVRVCMQTGIGDSQLVLLLTCSVMTLGSRLERGFVRYTTYFFVLVSYLCAIPEKKTFLLGSKLLKKICRSIFSASKILKEHFEDGVQMWFVSEDEFSPPCRCQMQRRSWAQPHKDCSTSCWLTHAKKSIDFIFRGCKQTFVPWSSCRDAGSINSLLYVISPCTGDLFLCLQVLQEEGMESAVAECCTTGLFECCYFLKLLKEPSFKTCWRNRTKENIKPDITIEMLSSPNNLLRIVFSVFFKVWYVCRVHL